MTAQAIQTQYKGYHFRSRLEARWAVFFDALELTWEYEKEGFELGNGERYLPDFYIHAVGDRGGAFVEVKPLEGSDNSKARRFHEQTGKPIILVSGVPLAKGYHGIDAAEPGDHYYDFFVHRSSKYAPIYWFTDEFDTGFAEDRRLVAACVAARSARFEFGECGATL